MINVRVRAHDGENFQFVFAQNFEDPVHFVARINNNRLVRCRIAENRAIALKHSDGNDFVNQILRHLIEYISLELPVGQSSNS